MKNMESSEKTPSKSKSIIVNKVFTNTLNVCDSPFRSLPHVSTPPSRFSRIINPFEPHLIERLHLPIFSPNVFTQVSTPKTEDKFRWTIDDISSLKPADIDEAAISQHVIEHDSVVESLVQEKIDKFFKEKAVVPSPLNHDIRVELPSESPLKAQYIDASAQTTLTLPPVLPLELEVALKPYFTYTENQQDDPNSSLYCKLFDEHEEDLISVQSSPALSTGLSPIQFSPIITRKIVTEHCETLLEQPLIKNCNLSPIENFNDNEKSRESRSACRLSFSGHMSVDASFLVPDVNQETNFTAFVESEGVSFIASQELFSDKAKFNSNLDMEFHEVSLLTPSPPQSPDEKMDNSIPPSSYTPHARIFASQRKRLSDSFKDENYDSQMTVSLKSKDERMSMDDIGYCTGGGTFSENSNWNKVNVYASTPTRKKN